VYALRHPDAVRSIVLDGAYPLDFDPWSRDRVAAFRDAVELVCKRDGHCRGQRVLADLAWIDKKLHRHPLAIRAHGAVLPFGSAQLAFLGFAAHGELDLYGQLPAVARAARAGDWAPLRALATALVSAATTVPTHAEGLWLGAFAATSCHDYPSAYGRSLPLAARRRAFTRSVAGLRRAYAPFGATAWPSAVREGGDTCIQWPGNESVDVPAGKVGARTLILAGDLDSNTPVASARRALRERFAHGPVVIVPNAGHTPIGTDATGCAATLAFEFLDRGAVGGTACLRRIPHVAVAH
jgi:pimeloyl-ACP methyl ester carboxylesterase